MCITSLCCSTGGRRVHLCLFKQNKDKVETINSSASAQEDGVYTFVSEDPKKASFRNLVGGCAAGRQQGLGRPPGGVPAAQTVHAMGA